MLENKNIIVVDRSRLATNFYSILLSNKGCTLIELKDLPSLAQRIKRREKIDLIIVSSNVFKKGSEKNDFAVFKNDKSVSDIKKVFLCKDNPSDEVWKIILKELPNSTIISRPFHPPEFLQELDRITGG